MFFIKQMRSSGYQMYFSSPYTPVSQLSVCPKTGLYFQGHNPNSHATYLYIHESPD